MGRKNNISGTKKADSEANGFEISFIKKDIRRSSNTVQDEHEHLMCAFPLRLRYASAITRRPNHLSGTNVNDLIEIKKKFDKKIRDWQKGGDINLGDFMMFIALELRFRASESNDKTHSYYVSVYESNNKYTLRISDHHFNADTSKKDNAIRTTSVTFSTPYDDDNHENWDLFKPDKQVKAIEYVYYESAIDKEKLIAIAKDVFDFLRTGTYIPSVKPNEIHNSPIDSLDGLCGLDGVSNAQFEDYKKGINNYYKPYSFSTANKIYLPDTNLVAGYIKRAASHMSPEQTKELLNFVREKETEIYNKYKKHIFTDRHSVWKLVDFNERESREDITLELTNCKVELSYTDDRLRIMFDSIPTYEQRNMLKHIGFHWSPSNKAWQRQLTDNAIIAIVNTLSKYDWLLTTEDRVKIKSAYVHPEHKQPQPEQPQPEQPKTNKKPLIYFAFYLSQAFKNGESFDWTKAQKFAEQLNIEATQQELMQACELGVVLAARQIAHNGQSIAQRFAALKDLYEQQVTIRPLDTQSKILQQYSTPCPLAFLLGEFILPKDYNGKWGYFLEPSAGNGMLTIALPANRTVVNEIDNIRHDNLKLQDFHKVCNQDASIERPRKDIFIGVITNPPFGKLKDKDKIERNGWAINTLDYKMAVLALDSMDGDGKAAIIVGGKMWDSYWKPLSDTSDKKVLFGQWKTFLGYLYAQYNVVDVIYVNGDNIYRKQGTQYPIVIILIDGRHQYDESNKPRYVFDNVQDTIIQTYDELFDRLSPYIIEEPTPAPDNDRERRLRLAKARAKAMIMLQEQRNRETTQN